MSAEYKLCCDECRVLLPLANTNGLHPLICRDTWEFIGMLIKHHRHGTGMRVVSEHDWEFNSELYRSPDDDAFEEPARLKTLAERHDIDYHENVGTKHQDLMCSMLNHLREICLASKLVLETTRSSESEYLRELSSALFSCQRVFAAAEIALRNVS